jgi:hypothetical protein
MGVTPNTQPTAQERLTMTRFLSPFAAMLALAAWAGRPAPMATPATAPAVPAARQAVPLRYTAGTGHYRFESQSHVVQEMMGQTNAVDLTTGALMTVAVAESAGTLGVAITIDSLGITMPEGMPGPDSAELASARGATVRLLSSPRGETISVTPPESASATVQRVAAGFREFLPMLPEGVPDSGTTWVDSGSTTVPSQGLALTIRTTRQHRVLGWETHDGARALHLAMVASYTVSGSGEAQGQQLDLTGSGQRTADAFISEAGVYLGGTLTDSSLVNANVVTAGIVVPVRSQTRSTFTRLP